jgi:hypothetical protein
MTKRNLTTTMVELDERTLERAKRAAQRDRKADEPRRDKRRMRPESRAGLREIRKRDADRTEALRAHESWGMNWGDEG